MSNQLPDIRRIDVFFYGLFMDEGLLREKGINPTNGRVAFVADFALKIGQRATLVPSAGNTAHGVVFSLTHQEVDLLYKEPSVGDYRPEPVLARLDNGTEIPALCFNLPTIDSTTKRNVEYAAKLKQLATRLNLPVSYVDDI